MTIDTSTDTPTSPAEPTFLYDFKYTVGKSEMTSFTDDSIELDESTFPAGFIALMDTDRRISKKFGLPLKKQVKCPECGIDGALIQVISHLNNKTGQTNNPFDIAHGTHDWSFKRIGHWLKELGY